MHRIRLTPLVAMSLLSIIAQTPVFADVSSAPAPQTEGERKAYEETIPGHLVKIPMVPIPAGKITLTDPMTKQPKTFDIKPLWFGKTEVTWDAYDIFAFRLDLTEEQKAAGAEAKTRPSKPYGAPDHGWGHQNYPALHIHSNAAEMFCKWLSAKTGKKYRLPTEAEWEYACRAGSPPAAPLTAKELGKIAWFWDNADETTHEVATKAPNAWGLYDMLGNAVEWVTGLDGQPVACGGSYRDKAPKVQITSRAKLVPEWQMTDAHTPKSKWWLSDGEFVGFRIVREE